MADKKETTKERFFKKMKEHLAKKEKLDRSSSLRHIPSAFDSTDSTFDLNTSTSLIQELELSVSEKNDIIGRLSDELEKAGRQIDAMGIKLNAVASHNNNHLTQETAKIQQEFEKQLETQQRRLQAEVEKTKMLEVTLAGQNTTQNHYDRLTEDLDDQSQKLFQAQDELHRASSVIKELKQKLETQESAFSNMEKREAEHITLQHAQIDKLEGDFKKRQLEADAKLRFLIEEKTRFERQAKEFKNDFEESQDENKRIRSSLEEENADLFQERQKYLELYLAQEKSLSEKIRERDAKISDLEDQVAGFQDISSSDEDDNLIITTDQINMKFNEVTTENELLRTELTSTFAESNLVSDEYDRIKAENVNLRIEHDKGKAINDNYLRLQTQHEQLQGQLAQATKSIEELTEASSANGHELNTKVVELQEDLAIAQTAITSAESQNEQLSSRIKQLIEEKETEKTQFRSLYDSAVHECTAKNEELISNLNREIEVRGTLIVENKKQFEEERQLLETKVEEHEENIEYFKDVIQNAKAEADESAASAQSIEAGFREKIEQLTEDLSSERATTTELDQQLNQKHSEIKELTGRVSTFVTVQDQMRNMSKEWSDKLEALSTVKAQLVAERDQLYNSQKETSDQKERLLVKFNELSENFKVAEASTSKMEEIIAEMSKKDEQSQQILIQKDTEIELLREKANHLDQLEVDYSELQLHVETQEAGFNAEREVFQNENEMSKEEIASLIKDYQLFSVQLANKDDQLKLFGQIQEQLHQVEIERNDLSASLKEQYDIVARKNEENKEISEKFASLTSDHDILKVKLSSKEVEVLESSKLQNAQTTAAGFELDQVRSELEATKGTLSSLESDNSNLREEIDVLNSVKVDAEDRLRELETECKELSAKAVELCDLQETHNIVIDEYNDLEVQLKFSGDESLNLKMKVEQLQSSLAKVLADGAIAVGSNQELERRLSEVVIEKQSIYEELVSQRKSNEENLNSLLTKQEIVKKFKPIVYKFAHEDEDLDDSVELVDIEKLHKALDGRDQEHSNQITHLMAELDEIRVELADKAAENSNFVEQLNSARKDCDQLAAEIVTQHKRFTQEKEDLEKDNTERIRSVSKEKDDELDEMEAQFNKQLNGKIDEFNDKIQELNEEIEQRNQQIEKLQNEHRQNLSNIQHDISQTNVDRDIEMEALTQDMAELIPYAEQLKAENDQLKDEVIELNRKCEVTTQEHLDILTQIQSENNKNENLRREVDKLTSDIEAKTANENRLMDQVNALKTSIGRIQGEYNEFKSLNMSVATYATNATEYIPIQIRQPVLEAGQVGVAEQYESESIQEGSLPDSDIMEMGSKDIEIHKLRDHVEELESKLAKYESPDLDNSQVIQDNQNELILLESKIEDLSREREDQLMAKNDHISEIEELRAHEKSISRQDIAKLREKINELQEQLDKHEEIPQDGGKLVEQNEFLQRQAEEFADELERTINTEEQLSSENIQLRTELAALKKELEQIRVDTPERFERLMTGFGHERKEFDEVHEKIFDENEQLRTALVKIYSRVKDAMTLANPNLGQSESSILEQHPIGDDEMDLEEGLAATEQVIQLLDQIIQQGKEVQLENGELELPGLNNPFITTVENLETTFGQTKDESFTGYGEDIPLPLSPKKPGSELLEMKQEISKIRNENNTLQQELKTLITDRLENANDEVRRMYEHLQLNMFNERNTKDEEIRRLQHLVEDQVRRQGANFEALLSENGDLRTRLEFVERESDTKSDFIAKQEHEQEADRESLEKKVHLLQLALEKAKDSNKIELAATLEESVQNSSLGVIQASEKIEQLERELEREREYKQKIQFDYNNLCTKYKTYFRRCKELEQAEQESQKRSRVISAVELEKEQLQEELKSAFDRISELETFIDRLKFGESSIKSKTMSTNSLNSTSSNTKPFADESRLNKTPDDSHESAPSPDHAKLAADLELKTKAIDDLQSQISELRDVLDMERAKAALSPRNKPSKTVHSLLEDLSEKDNQIFEKEEELFVLQDELSRSKTDNEKLKQELSNLSVKSIDQNETVEIKEFSNLQVKCEMQEEIISKMAKQIDLLKQTQDHDESLCDFSMKDELNLSGVDGNHTQPEGPLVDFDSPRDISSNYDELRIKQEDNERLEGTIKELKNELELAESRVSDLLKSQTEKNAKGRHESMAMLVELRDELERVNEERVSLIITLDDLKKDFNGLEDERSNLHEKLQKFESEKQKVFEELDEQQEIGDKLVAENQTLKNQSDQLKELYEDAQAEIKFLSEAKMENARLQVKAEAAAVLEQQLEELLQDKRELDFKLNQTTDIVNKVKTDKAQLDNEMCTLNKKLIDAEVRQQEQQSTISELLSQIQTDRADVEHTKVHTREKETLFIKQQTAKVTEINEMRDEIDHMSAEREDLVSENSSLKRRVNELVVQMENMSKEAELSATGEDLMSRLQAELDQQEAIDRQLIGHLTGNDGDRPHLDGRIQALLDRVHDEGMSILALSEAQVVRAETDSERQRDVDCMSRRIEGQLEQEKLVNRDLTDALDRAQHRLQEVEMMADTDKRQIELLSTKLGQSSRDHGEKCLEVSRCLADIDMLKEEIDTKSQQLEHTQQVVDSLRKDSENMRNEFAKFDKKSATFDEQAQHLEQRMADASSEKARVMDDLENARDDNSRLRGDLRQARLDYENLKSNIGAGNSKLEECVKRARDAETAEKKLNGTLHRELEVEQDSSNKLRGKIRNLEQQLTDTESNTTDEVDGLKSQVDEFKSALESARRQTQIAMQDRDQQAEEKLLAMTKLDAVMKKEQRLQSHVRSLELRAQNASMNSGSSTEGEDKQNLYQVRCGLEACRQNLGALAARLMVATVRSDEDELKASKEELSEAHRNLAFYARLLNSSFSSKRAAETGLLDQRLREQLVNLERNSEKLQSLQSVVKGDSHTLSEVRTRVTAQKRQIDQLNNEKLSLQNQLDELRLTRTESWNNENLSHSTSLARKQQKTYERYVRAESARKALVYQKKYLLLTIGGFQSTEQVTLATLSKIGGFKNPAEVRSPPHPKRRFVAAVKAVIAISRLKFLNRSWQKRITKTRSNSKDALAVALSSRLNVDHLERGMY